MSESSEVVGGGMSAAIATTPEVSVALTPVEDRGGGTSPRDAPLGPKGSTHK